MAVRARRAELCISEPGIDLLITDEQREAARAVALIEILARDVDRSRGALIRVASVARLTRAARRCLASGRGFPRHDGCVGVAIALHRLGFDASREVAGAAGRIGNA